MAARITNLIVASFVLLLSTAAYPQTKPTAREIINGMVAQYKTLSSYQDAGDVVVAQAEPKIARLGNISFQSPPRAGETIVSYRTYFVRPKLFRFDWNPSGTHSRDASIWSDGKKIYEWMPAFGTRETNFTLTTSKHLDMTIMDAARSSAGAVYPLISMFITGANVVTSLADTLDMATELALLKEEPVDGEMCYVIKANLGGAPWTLWIAKQRKLIRRTRTVYSYGSFDESVRTGVQKQFVAEETRRDIKINEPIAKNVFSYRPTLQSGDFDLTR